MTNGQVAFPLVIRTANGGGVRFGAQHSQSVENWAMAIPGLKVVAPSTPVDMVGLMAAAVRDPDPVDRSSSTRCSTRTKGDVPDGEIVDELGTAQVAPGRRRRHDRARSARWCRGRSRPPSGSPHDGIAAEVIDVRSLVPLDVRDASLDSVEQDRAALHGRGEPPALRLGSRDRVDRGGRGVLRARRPDRPDDDAASAAAVGRRPGGRRDPVGRSDRRGRAALVRMRDVT